jgi:hypothetical protein
MDFHRKAKEEQEELTEDTRPDRWDGEFAGRNRPYLEWLRDEFEMLSADEQHILLWREGDIRFAVIGKWLGIK